MSPLSFAIPPGTVIRGILGALIGIDKSESPEYFHGIDLSLRLINPVKKVNIPTNLLKTTSRKHFARYENHKPTNIEFAKDVRYRIYLKTEQKEIYASIKKHLINHSSVYTLSVGISEALANFENFRETTVESNILEKTTIDSIIPTDLISDPDFKEVEIFTTTLPMKMMNDREIIEYREFAFERRGLPIRAKVESAVKLSSGDHVVFF